VVSSILCITFHSINILSRSLASSGAFITLFAVAIDPLSQQLIAYRTEGEVAKGANATVPITMTYLEVPDNAAAVIGPGWQGLVEVFDQNPKEYSYISAGMKNAIHSGLGNGNE
jgi:hypothetical protein